MKPKTINDNNKFLTTCLGYGLFFFYKTDITYHGKPKMRFILTHMDITATIQEATECFNRDNLLINLNLKLRRP